MRDRKARSADLSLTFFCPTSLTGQTGLTWFFFSFRTKLDRLER